jgi:hypothetical protein
MGVPRKRVMPPVRAIPVALSGHPVVLMDRHRLFLPVCVFTYLFVRPVQHRLAGLLSFPVDSALNRS